MKCNYKKHIPVADSIVTYTDEKHFNDMGSSFIRGDIYPDFKGQPDGAWLHLTFGGLVLICTLKNPTPLEILSFHQNDVKFALVEENNILFLLSKFWIDNWGSSTMNYSLNISPSDLDDNANLLTVLLIDSSNGKLVGTRVLGLHWHFVKALNDAIRKQLSTPYSMSEFNRLVHSTYRKYPTDRDMLKSAYYVYNFNDTETNEMLDRQLKNGGS